MQVWFPGYGWQSFDPTAVVPLANPAPGSTLVHDATDALRHVPALPVGIPLAVGAGIWVLMVWRRRRPANWMELVARRIEQKGAHAGRRRGTGETLAEYAAALDDLSADRSGSWRALAWMVEAAAYGDPNSGLDQRRQEALAMSRSLRLPRRRARGQPGAPRNGDAPGDDGDGSGTAGPGNEVRVGGPGLRRSSPPPREGPDTPSVGADG